MHFLDGGAKARTGRLCYQGLFWDNLLSHFSVVTINLNESAFFAVKSQGKHHQMLTIMLIPIFCFYSLFWVKILWSSYIFFFSVNWYNEHVHRLQALSLPHTLPASAGAQLDSFPILSPSGVGWTQASTGHNCPVLSECASHCPYCLGTIQIPFALWQMPWSLDPHACPWPNVHHNSTGFDLQIINWKFKLKILACQIIHPHRFISLIAQNGFLEYTSSLGGNQTFFIATFLVTHCSTSNLQDAFV